MELTLTQKKFIEMWGDLAAEWAVSRSFAEIQALLLLSQEPLTSDQIMDLLRISRGNTSMNLRDLVDRELVYRSSRKGERRDYFEAEKDLWHVTQRLMVLKRVQELELVKECAERLVQDLPQDGAPQDTKVSEVAMEVRSFVADMAEVLTVISRSGPSCLKDTLEYLRSKGTI